MMTHKNSRYLCIYYMHMRKFITTNTITIKIINNFFITFPPFLSLPSAYHIQLPTWNSLKEFFYNIYFIIKNGTWWNNAKNYLQYRSYEHPKWLWGKAPGPKWIPFFFVFHQIGARPPDDQSEWNVNRKTKWCCQNTVNRPCKSCQNDIIIYDANGNEITTYPNISRCGQP